MNGWIRFVGGSYHDKELDMPQWPNAITIRPHANTGSEPEQVYRLKERVSRGVKCFEYVHAPECLN